MNTSHSIPSYLNPPFYRKDQQGFSLVEVMVATTVLILMIVMTAQTIDALSKATVRSIKRMDVDNEARLVLNRIGQDISSALKRKDIDYYFDKRTGNDQFAIFSQTSGYFPSGVGGVIPTSPIALVGYRIHNHEIQRLNKALVWNGVNPAGGTSGEGEIIPMAFLPLTIASTWPDVTGTGTDADYQSIGGQIFRMEFSFLLTDNTISTDPWLPSNNEINGMVDVTAIIISFAAMDFRNRQTVANLTSVADQLPDISGNTITTLPAELWQEELEAGNLSILDTTAAGIRIFQSYFPVDQ